MSTTPIRFEGKVFGSVAEFAAAYPAYARCIDSIRDGAETIAEVERRVAAGKQKAFASTRARAQMAYALKTGAR
ncbi:MULTISPECIES: hypothetical protein [Xanthomonas]|uniref:hypothetical protein n=1 Tax=Xanthomonas TaxID=338 RepID=UPI001AD95CDD|nr:hypothetical protein [Xanthomonas phaseoli]MBO9766496.1 hypothetical protein [Xanthomonas phaseoli pv. dieffenbachiae]MBO9776159.1 hypothetical protein [Xanthomonas phaseoli pv. dieffenbachiae]MBO9778242.1 hypothetical protein [Xanthomonas phaseoli pv. dieffenbachiae]MBO9795369.1 hypothetical protein [Xanthomonas phaseoli pv. dieffenbachiae]MBO9801436.1 hypothetical protein [Xanthomonas phaseoli pv. dieffenbachiae]